jgi:hypothetical protein
MALFKTAFAVWCCNRNVIHIARNRNIMSSSFRAEKAMEELQNNPYYEKYSKKISKFQKFVISC